MKVRGVLFDSGDTLVYPKGGSWWPGPGFQSLLRNHGLAGFEIKPDRMNIALEEGEKCLAANHSIVNLEEEREQFRAYYRTVCKSLGLSEVSDTLIEELACAYVDECNFELYADTVGTLHSLKKQHITLGVLSDAWPSLEKKYVTLGIRDYFTSFTISAMVGCCKPCEEIYRRAVADIGVPAESVLFVDDDPGNVEAALRLGMNGLVLLRNKETAIPEGLPSVRDLQGIFLYDVGDSIRR